MMDSSLDPEVVTTKIEREMRVAYEEAELEAAAAAREKQRQQELVVSAEPSRETPAMTQTMQPSREETTADPVESGLPTSQIVGIFIISFLLLGAFLLLVKKKS